MNAAAEAEESARRQDRQDNKKSKDGLLGGKKEKVRERRTVYVGLEGGATNPKGYERNKVRTSKYTLLTFFPKVSTPARAKPPRD